MKLIMNIIRRIFTFVLICECMLSSTAAIAESKDKLYSKDNNSSYSSDDNNLLKNYYSRRYRRNKSLGSRLFILGTTIVIYGAVSYKKNGMKKNISLNNDEEKIKEAEEIISRVKEINEEYSNEKLMDKVNKSFYSIYQGYTTMELDLCREYMSDKLYCLSKYKIENMILKREQNIVKDVELVNIWPIGVEHYFNCLNDSIWFKIKGSKADYTINIDSGDFLYGSRHNSVFFEYWKVIRENNKWVVDEIRDSDEINEDQFITCSEE